MYGARRTSDDCAVRSALPDRHRIPARTCVSTEGFYGKRYGQVVQRRQGFGFISPDEGGEELFAHFSAIQMNGFKTLKEGQRVAFDVTQGPKGKQATNIQAA